MLKAVRSILGWALVAAGIVAAFVWSGGSSAQAQVDADVVALGAELYAVNCAACHGPRGEGGPPDGTLRAGPPVAGIDINYADQQMRTGRMPIADRRSGVVRDDSTPLEDHEREAILAWMVEHLDLTGEIPQIGEGDASRGQELYTFHCAACHGSVGNGGISGSGVIVLGLRGLDPLAIVQATRVGPYNMPAFDETVIPDQDAWDIAAFAEAELASPRVTPLGVPELNRVALSGFAIVLLLTVVGGLVLISRDVPFPADDEEGS
jgi:ubiquinol-cytochrome c reductase cytochrome c subunit